MLGRHRSRVSFRNCKKLILSHDAEFSVNIVQFNRISFLVVCLLLLQQIKTRSCYLWKWNHRVNKFTLVAYIRFKGTKAFSRPVTHFFMVFLLSRSNPDLYWRRKKQQEIRLKFARHRIPCLWKLFFFANLNEMSTTVSDITYYFWHNVYSIWKIFHIKISYAVVKP